MKFQFFSLLLFLSSAGFCQNPTVSQQYNFNFENPIDTNSKVAVDWIAMPRGTDFHFKIDSTVKKSGKYSLLIEPGEGVDVEHNFGGAGYKIKNTFNGKYVEVKAYMKCESVKGSIRLMLRVDGENHKVLEFDNMTNKTIDGSRNWKLYSLKLPIPPEGKEIYVGGILIGKGKLWLDDFKVFVDGKDIQLLK